MTVAERTSAPTPKASPAAETSKYSWKDVAKHNKEQDCWIIVEGNVYDVTEWVPKHPGGPEVLRLCAGRECTELMMSYHPFTEKPWKVLEAYKIGVCTDKEFPTYEPDTGFWREVKTAVGDYFRENSIDSKDWLPGLWRMVPVFIGAILTYSVMNDIALPLPYFGLSEAGDAVEPVAWSWSSKVAASLLFGLFQAFPLLHVMHDACHCAYSHSESIQQFMGRLTLDWFAGCSMLSWQHQHVVGHHVYTNVYQADPDIPLDGNDPRRIVKDQPWAWVYRFQWLYMPVLYGVLAIKMRYEDIASVWLAERDGPVRVNFFDPVAIRVYAVKGSWITWRIVLPLVLFNQSWQQVLTLFAIAELVTGYWLAFNFQVSHVSTEATWPEVKDPKTMELDCEWAVSQVTTGVNYYANPFGDFLCGALNYQIEHHLFPCVSQYHYPAIAPIVERIVKKHGLKYNSLPSYTAAITAHIRHLYDLGLKGEAAPFHLD